MEMLSQRSKRSIKSAGAMIAGFPWRCEQSAAASLADILRELSPDKPELPDKLIVNGIQLTEEQHSAVRLALSSRLSLGLV